MLFVDDQVALSFPLSLFSLDRWRLEMEMEGIGMDDALPQKRRKKELYTLLVLVLVLVSLVL